MFVTIGLEKHVLKRNTTQTPESIIHDYLGNQYIRFTYSGN